MNRDEGENTSEIFGVSEPHAAVSTGYLPHLATASGFNGKCEWI